MRHGRRRGAATEHQPLPADAGKTHMNAATQDGDRAVNATVSRFGPWTRVISGGQTGADRAALDWAIAHSIPVGGSCPRGRRAEDGPIPDRYPLQELNSANSP